MHAVRAALEADGFVKLPRVFSPGEVGQVESLLDGLQGRLSGVRTRHVHDMGAADSDSEGDQVEIAFATCLQPELLGTELFRKCRDLAREVDHAFELSFDHVIIKSPFNQTETLWHQDISYVRSKLLFSELHFWIPLQDTPVESGCMEFIAKSHETRLPHQSFARKDGTTSFFVPEVDSTNRVPCPLEVGDLTIHTPMTLHYTGRNRSDKPRKAWILHFSRFDHLKLAAKRLMGEAPAALTV